MKINPSRPLEASDSEARHDDADHAHEFNKDVERWSRSVFEGVANGVSDHSSLMSIRAFTTEITLFDILLRIIPCTTSIRHEDGKVEGSGQTAYQHTLSACLSEQKTHDDRDYDGQERWDNHLVLSTLCTDFHTSAVVWCTCSF